MSNKKEMEFIIVTGLSGAGKTKTINAMEDIGFYCVDNLPPAMIPIFYDLCDKAAEWPKRVAVVTDTRGGDLFKSFFDALETLKKEEKKYKILFLDASDSVLVNRYQETRRKHPISEELSGSLERAVKLEREILKPVKEAADFIVDTSKIKAQEMKSIILELFLENHDHAMAVHCVSFGFKHGIPMECDLLFDVRCLPNPFYIDELKPLRGTDAPVKKYVMEQKETEGLLTRLLDMIDYLIPLYVKEGKSQLVIGIGCTGGHHRSVAIAQYLYEHLSENKIRAGVHHRDIAK